jgi:peptidoglycan/LPS O-acetylase OafA/YrhL
MGILRLILALAVVMGHSGLLFGWTLFESVAAVQCFYVISGFYMALVLDGAYEKGTAGVLKFYASRYLRLAPTYWVVLAATLIGGVLFHRSIYQPWAELKPMLAAMNGKTLAVLAFTNLFILGQDAVMFLGFNPARGDLYWTAHYQADALPAFKFLLIPQAWSLGVELLFYLVAPFILRRRTWVLPVIVVASLAVRVVLARHGLGGDPWNYRFFPSELGIFLCGSLAYRAYRHGWGVLPRREAAWLLAAILAVLFVYQRVEVAEIVKRYAVVALVAAGLPSVFSLSRNWKRDNYVGKLSYPIYVCHFMLLGFAHRAGRFSVPALMLASVALAALLVHFVEDPVDVWRSRLRAERRAY